MALNDTTTTVASGGRIVIPAEFRRVLEIDVGDEVILRLVQGEVHILTRDHAVRKAQELVRRSIPSGRPLVKELSEERRKAARHE
jgi:AbrB family looped-hinge helix DNA binding protein